jgi:hypothetical protein
MGLFSHMKEFVVGSSTKRCSALLCSKLLSTGKYVLFANSIHIYCPGVDIADVANRAVVLLWLYT